MVRMPDSQSGDTGSNPVRVTKPYARKQRNIAVSEFFFYSENPLCSLSVLFFENAE